MAKQIRIAGLESCTTDAGTSKPFLLDGRFVTLIDTPGFDDTIRNDTDVLTLAIAAYLSNTYEHGAKLSGIIYMHHFHIFRELCGESTLSNVLIATNMWGNVDPKIGEERERELATSDKLFKPVLEKGAQLLRHDNTEASAHTILRNLINSQTATLAIQHEIVNQRKDLARTAAGAELTRLLKEQAERYGDEVGKLRGELKLATRAKDEARKELQEEREEFECMTRLLVEERLARKQAEAQCGKVQANGAGGQKLSVLQIRSR
ncbi:hypothetical protein EDC04DRAFT_2874301 [Pisolithus marmoratus]|nr:hypothetical protein EDC04DRAFT_2874301 [Pisolithus marmoratus]